MIETGFGHVLVVSQIDLGSVLDGDHAAGATVLLVEDCADFDDTDGGQVVINGTTYTYDGSGVDDDSSTVTITPGLTAAAADGDSVLLLDPLTLDTSTEWVAEVTVDGTEPGDTLEASIRSSLVDQLPDGLRGIVGESVALEWDEDDELWVVDILGQPADATNRAGSVQFINTDDATATGAGDVLVNLAYLPINGSEHVHWHPNGGGGVHLRPADWSRDGQVLTVPDPGYFAAGDVIAVEYAYRRGITTQEAPDDPVAPPTPSVVGYTRETNANPTVTFAIPAGTQAGDLLILSLRGPISSGGEELTLAQSCTDPRMTEVFAATTRHGSTNRPVMHKVWTGVADGSGSPIVVTVTPDASNITNSIGMLAVIHGAHGFGVIQSTESGTSTPVVAAVAAVAVTAVRSGGFVSVGAAAPSGYGGVGGASGELASASTLVSSWYDPAATQSPSGTFSGEDCVVIALI